MIAVRSVWSRILLGCLPACIALAPRAAALQHELRTRVDPRIELLCAVARLAGLREFNMPNSRSPYSERVEERLRGLKEHVAVTTLRTLHSQHGVSYDAIPSLAVHLDGLERLALLAPIEPRPERLDARWERSLTERFLAELRDFSTQAEFPGFVASEREFYAQVEQRLFATLTQSRALSWFDEFFGAKPGAQYVAIAGLLCGGGNYGVGARLAGAPEQVTPVFGCWKFDEQGLPVFDDSYLPLYIHELCHTYTNPFIDGHEQQLRAAAERLYANCASKMAPQGYGNGRTVLYESLVRACVVRCRAALEGEDAAREQLEREHSRHFRWTGELAHLLRQYETDRERWPNFESFMPKVVEFFAAYAASLPTASAAAPKLVGSTPLNGADSVDPGLTELWFEFDQPMRDQSWSIVGRPEDQPKIVGKLAYDSARKRLRVPVQLEPGREYRFALNSERNANFVSEAGAPLEPVSFRFRTAAR